MENRPLHQPPTVPAPSERPQQGYRVATDAPDHIRALAVHHVLEDAENWYVPVRRKAQRPQIANTAPAPAAQRYAAPVAEQVNRPIFAEVPSQVATSHEADLREPVAATPQLVTPQQLPSAEQQIEADDKLKQAPRHRIMAGVLTLVLVGGAGYLFRNDLPGLSGPAAEASDGSTTHEQSAATLVDATSDDITHSTLIDTVNVTASAQVNVAINTKDVPATGVTAAIPGAQSLPFDKKPHVALSNNQKPKVVFNTTVGLYPLTVTSTATSSAAASESATAKPFAVASGNTYDVDRSLIELSPIIATLPQADIDNNICDDPKTGQKECIDNFGASGSMPQGVTPRGLIDADEASRVTKILQPPTATRAADPSFAAYNAGILHEIEYVALQKIENDCGEAIQTDTDNMVRAVLQQKAASLGVTLKDDKDGGIHFSGKYGGAGNSMSAAFKALNPDAAPDLSTTDINVTAYALQPDSETVTCSVQSPNAAATPTNQVSAPATQPAAGNAPGANTPPSAAVTTTPVTGATS